LWFYFFLIIRILIIRIDITSAITPPSFEGIERKITYANRKYHSGWIWRGATRGLAGLKFSTSPRILGIFEIINIIMIIIVNIGIVSFIENIGLNFTLSKLVIVFVGFEEPFSCKRIKWDKTKAAISIGTMK